LSSTGWLFLELIKILMKNDNNSYDAYYHIAFHLFAFIIPSILHLNHYEFLASATFLSFFVFRFSLFLNIFRLTFQF